MYIANGIIPSLTKVVNILKEKKSNFGIKLDYIVDKKLITI